MKIVALNPKYEFTKEQRLTLSKLGSVVYAKDRERLPLGVLLNMTKDADILAVDPDSVGGFEKGKEIVTKIIESLPNLKGICLSTTSYGWVDLDYCRRRKISVCNIPHYSRESVAEHTLALLLCLSKRIILTDRKTQKGKYELGMGTELKGKTLGIIGLGSIGSRVAELGQAIGMKVIAYNRSPKRQVDVGMKSFSDVLKQSDAIAIHLIDSKETQGCIGKKQISLMKKGVIIVNTADRKIIDEVALFKALESGKVASYSFEGEDLDQGPLVGLENVIGLKGFGWYTKEALTNLFEIWVDNIKKLASGKPQNRVV